MSSPRRSAHGALAAALVAVLAAACPPLVRAQAYTIGWSNLDSGGPPALRMVGEPYTLAGSIGQSDAGTLAGGAFTILGGFWGAPIPRLLDAGSPPALAPDRLTPARPNPFSGATEVAFALARDSGVRLVVYDVAGQRVRVLLDGPTPKGEYHVHWDGAGDDGRRLPSGMYFLRLDTGTVRATQRAVLVH